MTLNDLSQLLNLYSWFLLAGLSLFLLLIARFYERFAGERTYFRLFIAPAVFFGVAVVRYGSINRVSGDAASAVLSALGGVLLAGLSLLLYRRMTLGRPS